MAEVSIEIAGRRYPVTCRDGEENHVRMIAGLVDAKAKDAQRAVGGVNEARHLLLAAMLLADELNDTRQKGGANLAGASAPAPAPQPDVAPIIDKLAARIENMAQWLEDEAARA